MDVLVHLVVLNDHPELAPVMRADGLAHLRAQFPPRPVTYKVADRAASALTRLDAVQADLLTRYPGS